MKLCNKCILPENYSGLIMDDNGTCNLCKQNTKIDYWGQDALKKDISEIIKKNKNKEYDCIVSFSGGRDSSYLLWYAIEKLKLKPLAVFIDSGLIPKQTIDNVKKISEKLGVQLVIKKHDFLLKSIDHSLKSWVKYPEAATLTNLCNGCRYGIGKLINDEAIKRKINLVLAGGTPFEKGFFKKNLISNNQNSHISFFVGYAKLVLKNPLLILSYHNLKMQVLEYFTMKSGYVNSQDKKNLTILSPFYKYVKWDERLVNDTIENALNWKSNPELNSTYRGDCVVGIIRQFLYNLMLGYNDKDDHLSWLIRDGQISREDALQRVENEKKVGIDTLKYTFSEIGIDYDSYVEEFKKNIKKHKIKLLGDDKFTAQCLFLDC